MSTSSQPIPCLDILEAELVRVLYQREDSNRLAKVKEVLERYTGIDWIPHQRCPRFDGYTALGYQRVCVKRHNDLFDLLVLSWAPGTKSPIHDHPCERCFLMCVSGSLYEDRFAVDDFGVPQFQKRSPIPPRVATWISDEIGLHSVGNDGDGVSCSLHCYIPGFTTPCTIYDCETKEMSSVQMAPNQPSEIPLPSVILQRVSQYMEEFDDPSKHRVSSSQSSDDIEVAFKRVRCGLKFDNCSLPLDDQAIISAVNLVSNLSVHTSHSFFFNQLLTKADPLASAADSLASIMNVNMYNYENAPVLMLMEQYVLQHLAQQVGIIKSTPTDDFDGIFLPGASLGNMTAMHAARQWFISRNMLEEGQTHKLAVFTSVESHDSISKACSILGFSKDSCRYIACDDDTGKICVPDLVRAIVAAKASGYIPFFINCTSGSTHSGSFDDCQAIADVANSYGCWLHVDGALGASFMLPKEEPFLSLTRGIDRADSISWNLHKLLGIPMPCSVLLTRHKNALTRAHVTTLSETGNGRGIHGDPSSKSIMSSRRADALKAWVLWKKVGDIGMANRVRLVYMHNMDLARMIRDYPRKVSIDNPTIMDDVDQPEDLNRGAFHLAYQPTSACTCFYWIPSQLRARFVNEGPRSIVRELGIVARGIKCRLLQDGVILISHFSTESRPHFWRIPNIHQSISQSSMWDILKLMNRVGSQLFPPEYCFDNPREVVGLPGSRDVEHDDINYKPNTNFEYGIFGTPYIG